jgi:hypothetical protein
MGEPGSRGACPVGWRARGKKVEPTALRLRRSRRSRSSARSVHPEARCVRALNSSSGEDVADVGYPAQDVDGFRRRERNRGVENAGIVCRGAAATECLRPVFMRRVVREGGLSALGLTGACVRSSIHHRDDVILQNSGRRGTAAQRSRVTAVRTGRGSSAVAPSGRTGGVQRAPSCAPRPCNR